MFKFLLTFGAGIYTGIYISQNYEVPRVDEPQKIIEKIKDFADDHRKNFPSTSSTATTSYDEIKSKTPAEQLVHDMKKSAKNIMN